jgi:transposase, IS5 family
MTTFALVSDAEDAAERVRPPRRESRLAGCGRAHPGDSQSGHDLSRRKTIEHGGGFHELVKWRAGSEGRISYLKRCYGWDRTRLDCREGAAIWCGHGVYAHKLVKIAALAS